MNHNYVITMTSGSYDDYEHGVIFAVANEQEAVIVTDLLNKYSVFRTRFREDLWEWDFQYSENKPVTNDRSLIMEWCKKKYKDTSKFIEDKYILSEDLALAEKLLKKSGINYDYDAWPEEVMFAYRALPVYDIKGLDGN